MPKDKVPATIPEFLKPVAHFGSLHMCFNFSSQSWG